MGNIGQARASWASIRTSILTLLEAIITGSLDRAEESKTAGIQSV